MSLQCCRALGQSRWFGSAVCVLVFVVSGSGAGPKKDSKPPPAAASESNPEETEPAGKVIKTNAEWRKLLTREQFEVTRLKETEEPYSGAYWQTKKDGLYRCVCCGQTLFDSRAKFDSGTGWPSFWEPVEKDAVAYRVDNSELEVRTEVICNRCDAHLGHVFNDGPAPTGRRFCMNSASLKRVNRDGTEETRKKPAKSSSKKKKQP